LLKSLLCTRSLSKNWWKTTRGRQWRCKKTSTGR
jgi:hypothetical protein